MKVKCEFCDSYYEDKETNCPYCGGANTAVGGYRFSNGVPKTIEELKRWAEQYNVPLTEMRVYIGDNNHSPKCLGIYREGTEVIVYKNKSDGTRAIRYQGSDEAYAVNEVYLKIKEMMSMAAAAKRAPDSRNNANGYHGSHNKRVSSAMGMMKVVIIIIIIVASLWVSAGEHGRGAQGYSSGSYSSSGYNSNSDYWDYDDSDDDYDWGWNQDSDDDYDWDSDWDSDYGDYDWDFDYDWDSDW